MPCRRTQLFTVTPVSSLADSNELVLLRTTQVCVAGLRMADDWFRPEQTRRFLEALDPSATGFTFQTFGDRHKSSSLARVFNGSFDQLAPALLSLNKQGAGVYVNVSLTDLKGRKLENVQAPRAVFCDFDGIEPPPGTGALPPSIVVQSRNGKHVYWLLDQAGDVTALPTWSAVQGALAEKLGADVACTDPSRVMRLPGLRHLKSDPFDVELLECHKERRYELEEIIRSYGLSLQQKEERRAHVVSRSGDGSNLADDYNLRGDWSFLSAHGWQHLGDYGDEGRWSRPGKEPPGLSATTDHEGHTGIFYVFSSNAAPFESSRGYSRYQAYAALEHGGDLGAASRALSTQGFGEDPKVWGKRKAQEREDELLKAALAEGPPPDLPRPKPTLVSNPPPPDDSWVPTDDDAPPEHRGRKASSKRGKSSKKKQSHRGKGNDGGPDLKVYTGGGGRTQDPQDGEIDFRVSKVTILGSDPPVWLLEIDGSKTIRLTTAEINNPKKFRERYLEVVYRRCSIPTGRGSDPAWTSVVNHWMTMANVVEQPEDASELGAIRVVLRGILRDASRGETGQDLKRGRVLAHPTKRDTYIVLGTNLRTYLRERFGEAVPAKDVGEAMHALGCKPDRVRVGNQQFRVWCFKRSLDEPDWCEEDAPPQGEIDLE